MLHMGWFSTGRGEGSLGLLRFIQERILRGEIDARIQFVFSNREPGEAEGSDRFFQQVRDYGLPLVSFSSRKYRRAAGGKFAELRTAYDREVMARLQSYSPDFCVLAGYMLIAGPEMCHRYTMLNLHPALPSGPIGTWQEVIWSLIESRADMTGAMVHLVTEAVDRGPVVTYFSVPIVGGPFDDCRPELEGKPANVLREEYGEELPLFRLIREEGYRREPFLLASTINSLAAGAVRISGGQVLDSSGNGIEELCLNEEIEGALKGSRD